LSDRTSGIPTAQRESAAKTPREHFHAGGAHLSHGAMAPRHQAQHYTHGLNTGRYHRQHNTTNVSAGCDGLNNTEERAKRAASRPAEATRGEARRGLPHARGPHSPLVRTVSPWPCSAQLSASATGGLRRDAVGASAEGGVDGRPGGCPGGWPWRQQHHAEAGVLEPRP